MTRPVLLLGMLTAVHLLVELTLHAQEQGVLTEQESRAIAEIENYGGRIEVRKTSSGEPRIAVDFRDARGYTDVP